MFKTTAIDSAANAYVDEVGVIPGTRIEANDKNITQDEMVAMVEETGQTLDATGVIRNQLFLALAAMGPGYQRAQFEYNDADQIDVGASMYMCKDKYCFWTSTLTTVATGAAGGAEWWYLYLDYSAITSGTEITNAEMIWSTTAPTFNDTYRQLMNGDDRCIFAVLTTAGNAIVEFLHGADKVFYADKFADLVETDIENVWTDVTITMPAFAIQAMVTFTAGVADIIAYWRTNGQAGAIGHIVNQMETLVGNFVSSNSFIVQSDSGQIIEVKNSAVSAATIQMETDGFFLPTGI